IEELRHLDLEGLEGDLDPVAEAKVHDGILARGLHLAGFEATPVLDDLIEALLAIVARACPILRDSLFPGFRGLDVLAAVLVRLAKHVPCPLAPRGLAALGDLAIDLDPVELLGQPETLDAGR